MGMDSGSYSCDGVCAVLWIADVSVFCKWCITMRSNCVIRAWDKFVTGDAEWLCLTRTKYSAMGKYTQQWYWMPLIPIGIALQWAGMVVLLIGWLLRWGGWYHAAWVRPDGQWWDYKPDQKKKGRVLPPFIFSGHDRIMQSRCGPQDPPKRR